MVKKFKEAIGTTVADAPNLSELIGTTFTIVNCKIKEGAFGEYALIELDNGEIYRTSSKILLDQIKDIMGSIVEEGVEVTLDSKTASKKGYNDYLTFK